MKASIIICTYNNQDCIRDCLDSVQRQTYKDFDCTVVDDGSDDRTIEIIKNEYLKIKLIKKLINSGPARSRNMGAELTKSKYLIFMDSDVKLESEWVSKQIRFMDENKQCGITGCKLIYPDKKTINSAGGWLSRLGFASDIGRDENQSLYNKEKLVPYVCSAACIIRRKDFERINGFDGEYFYPSEDVDICWRMWIINRAVIYNPEVIAYHAQGQSTGKMKNVVTFHATKNRICSMLKNYSIHNILLYLPIHLIIVGAYIVFPPRQEKLEGILWNFIHLDRIIRQRRIIQNLRMNKDKDILKMFNWRIR